jgi:hypothetical protein
VEGGTVEPFHVLRDLSAIGLNWTKSWIEKDTKSNRQNSTFWRQKAIKKREGVRFNRRTLWGAGASHGTKPLPFSPKRLF